MKTLITAFLTIFLAVNCGSGDKVLKPGESKDIEDADGNKIGTYLQVSDVESVSKYDRNKDEVADKAISMKNGQLNAVHYYGAKDNIVTKEIKYENNQPVKVTIFDGTEANKVVKEGKVENNKIVYFDIPDKNKRVFYKEDGTVDKIENINSN